MRIRLAAAITALTRAGRALGGISIPFGSSRAFGVGVQMSTSAGVMPPPPQFARGARRDDQSEGGARLSMQLAPP